MARLRAEYEVIEQAISRINGMQSEGQSALNQLTSTIMDMMDNWEGLASQAFMSWWSDIANSRAQEILGEFESLQNKLRQIQQVIQDNEQETAALFRVE